MIGKLFFYILLWYFIRECITELNGSNRSGTGTELDRCNKTIDIYQAVSSPPVTESNQGKPLHCSYRIRVRPARDDWVIFVRFTRLKIGQPSYDRKSCIGGYIQIIDGYRDSNYSNKDHSGYYCGEIDMPKTFISETPYVKIIFHSESYDYDTYVQFDATVEQQREVQARYGQYHSLYPHRRGIPIPGTYCERNYTECSPGPRCFVQSPGYPGIYSRNLRCRYHLSARQSLVGLELSAFDVDGQACDNLLMCFPRPVTTKENECLFDYVRIYDGPDEFSPIIATLCGRGRIKSSIISSANNMLVEFVTSPAGPLLSTGFHFKADAIIDTGDSQSIQMNNGSCIIEKKLSDSNLANMFTNIRSWYPANTTCLYKFFSLDPKYLISLEFTWFRVERVTLCQENLRLFDSSEPDMSTLITKLCDTNKPQTGSNKSTYITTGPSLTVQFFSSVGSLDGSSLNYGFDVRLILPSNDQDHTNDISKSCSRLITPDSLTSGSVSWNYEDFNKTITNTGSGSSSSSSSSSSSTSFINTIMCNATFDATSIQHGRINLTMYSPFVLTNCHECLESVNQARIIIYRNNDNLYHSHSHSHSHSHPNSHKQLLCYCKLSRTLNSVSYVISTGAQMIVSLQLPTEWVATITTTSHQASLIQVIYRFFTDTRCGPNEILTPQLQGSLHFPFNSDSNSDKLLIKPSYLYSSSIQDNHNDNNNNNNKNQNPIDSTSFSIDIPTNEPVFCSWKLPLFPQLDVAFNIIRLNLLANCSTDYLLLNDIKVCLNNNNSNGEILMISTNSQTKQQRTFEADKRKDIIIKSEDLMIHNDQTNNNNNNNNNNFNQATRNGITSNIVRIYYTSSNSFNSNFSLSYTQLKLLQMSSGEQLVSMGRNCQFLCGNPPACLNRELVCNGVVNCPEINGNSRSFSSMDEDENEEICKRNHFFPLLGRNHGLALLILSVAGFSSLCIITFLSICLCKSMKKKRERF